MTPEILAPAGSVQALHAAYLAGADAVYIGGQRFGARAYADNPDDDTLLECIALAHRLDKKLYLTVNTLIKEREMEELVRWLAPFYEAGLDAAIVQDLGLFVRLRDVFPELPLHVSTQAAVTGPAGAALLEKEGARRVIPARELSLAEIREIRAATELEIECFVHGAMCYSYSGRCLMSSLIGGRSGNRGRCAGICRLPFGNHDDRRQRGLYPLSMKDLCAVELLPDMLDAGVTSFKIEGRMKRPAYTAEVVRVYRNYLDLCLEDPAAFHVSMEDQARLHDLFNRDGFTRGYYYMMNGRDMIALENTKESESRSAGAQKIYAETDAALAQKKKQGGLQKKIAGELTFRVGCPARLVLSCEVDGQAVRAEIQGDLVEAAQNRPIGEEKLRELLTRTGEAPFAFGGLTITTEGEGFLPIGKINALRREAFRELDARIGARFARRVQRHPEEYSAPKTRGVEGAPELWAVCRTREQAEALLSIKEIQAIGLPLSLLAEDADFAGRLSGVGVTVRVVLPQLVRGLYTDEIRKMIRHVLAGDLSVDAWLACDLEGLALLCAMKEPLRIIADASLYTMNRSARNFIDRIACRATAPLELNVHELRERGCEGDDMIVYGRAPMMVSAQCVQKTLDGCNRGNGCRELVDRKGARFPVACSCDFCYNIVYNSLPTDLGREMDEVLLLRPASLRLEFTVENGGKTAKTAARFARCLSGEMPENPFEATTRGHFRRGAE